MWFVTQLERDKIRFFAWAAVACPMHTTSMTAVGFCGEWLIVTCDKKLVAINTKQARFDSVIL